METMLLGLTLLALLRVVGGAKERGKKTRVLTTNKMRDTCTPTGVDQVKLSVGREAKTKRNHLYPGLRNSVKR